MRTAAHCCLGHERYAALRMADQIEDHLEREEIEAWGHLRAFDTAPDGNSEEVRRLTVRTGVDGAPAPSIAHGPTIRCVRDAR